MAFDVNSPLGQCEQIYNSLSQFYTLTAGAVQNGGSFPKVSDIASSLEYTELHRYAYNNSDSSANFMTGSAVETVHLAASVLREYGMRIRSKSEYYAEGFDDHSRESDYYKSMSSFNVGMLQGNYTDGSLA